MCLCVCVCERESVCPRRFSWERTRVGGFLGNASVPRMKNARPRLHRSPSFLFPRKPKPRRRLGSLASRSRAGAACSTLRINANKKKKNAFPHSPDGFLLRSQRSAPRRAVAGPGWREGGCCVNVGANSDPCVCVSTRRVCVTVTRVTPGPQTWFTTLGWGWRGVTSQRDTKQAVPDAQAWPRDKESSELRFDNLWKHFEKQRWLNENVFNSCLLLLLCVFKQYQTTCRRRKCNQTDNKHKINTTCIPSFNMLCEVYFGDTSCTLFYTEQTFTFFHSLPSRVRCTRAHARVWGTWK